MCASGARIGTTRATTPTVRAFARKGRIHPPRAGGTNKATRGGGWAYTPRYVSVAARDCEHPAIGARDLGFRVGRYALFVPEPGLATGMLCIIGALFAIRRQR